MNVVQEEEAAIVQEAALMTDIEEGKLDSFNQEFEF